MIFTRIALRLTILALSLSFVSVETKKALPREETSRVRNELSL